MFPFKQRRAVASQNNSIVKADARENETERAGDKDQSVADKLYRKIEALTRENRELRQTEKEALQLVEKVDRVQRQLEHARAKDDALFASIGEGVIATDKDGTVIKINHTAYLLLGRLAKEQLIGKSIVEVLPIETSSGVRLSKKTHPVLVALYRGEKTVTVQSYCVPKKDGSRFSLAATITPIRLERKKAGVITVFRDITEEQKVAQARKEFISFASHQLRTPLTSMRWYIEWLEQGKGGQLSVKQQEYVAKLAGLSQRMVELIDAFLDISRIEIGSFDKTKQKVDVWDIADKVLEEFTAMIEQKSLIIEKEEREQMPLLTIVPYFIRVMFQNLLSNAIKYTPENGKISLGVTNEGGAVRIRVSDSGYGIPSSEQEKIFTKFFRAENVKKYSVEGSGLGLYIVKYVVERAGGSIWFSSEEGKGTTFFVEFPL